jgi:hypothetical protein
LGKAASHLIRHSVAASLGAVVEEAGIIRRLARRGATSAAA